MDLDWSNIWIFGSFCRYFSMQLLSGVCNRCVVVMGKEWVAFISNSSTTSNLYTVLLSMNPGRKGVQSTSHEPLRDTKMTNDNWDSINLYFRPLLYSTHNSTSCFLSCVTPFPSLPGGGCFCVTLSTYICYTPSSSSSSRDSRWVRPLASSPLAGPPLAQHNGTDCPCDAHSHTEGALLWGWVSLPRHMPPSPLECDYLHSP